MQTPFAQFLCVRCHDSVRSVLFAKTKKIEIHLEYELVWNRALPRFCLQCTIRRNNKTAQVELLENVQTCTGVMFGGSRARKRAVQKLCFEAIHFSFTKDDRFVL